MPICQIILSLSNFSSKKGFIKNWRLFCFWLILVFFLLSYSRCLFSTYSHMNQWLTEPTTFIQNGPSIWDCVWALLQWFGSHCMLSITFWLNLAHLKRYDFFPKFRLSIYVQLAFVTGVLMSSWHKITNPESTKFNFFSQNLLFVQLCFKRIFVW